MIYYQSRVYMLFPANPHNDWILRVMRSGLEAVQSASSSAEISEKGVILPLSHGFLWRTPGKFCLYLKLHQQGDCTYFS